MYLGMEKMTLYVKKERLDRFGVALKKILGTSSHNDRKLPFSAHRSSCDLCVSVANRYA